MSINLWGDQQSVYGVDNLYGSFRLYSGYALVGFCSPAD